ncbi:MAG TPA: ribosome small subunit-dependent GTPase A [Bacillota bacterium]|nr:ribosome small subunit-dependent GTPase A [Bacillota bacterium]
MLYQKDFGIEEYIDEYSIVSSNNVARIIQKNSHLYTIATTSQIIPQVVHRSDIDYYVGDFVVFDWQDEVYYIKDLLDRKNVISKASSHAAKSYHVHSYEQFLATNVDQLFILIAVDQRFTLSKLERYLMTFHRDDLDVTILISKVDFKEKAEYIMKMIQDTYPRLNVIPISMYHQDTVQRVKDFLNRRKTAMFIGASGVGKSTLINSFMGTQDENTNAVRRDGKGKHTTTVTKMLYLEDTDSFLIDSPGFKTISTTNEVDGKFLFEEIQELAGFCKFNDCTHSHEPGCAVKRAAHEGEISNEQLARYAIYEKKLRGQQKHERMKDLKKERSFIRNSK